VEEEAGEGYNILAIVLDNRYQGPAITGSEVGFEEFRHHLTWYIIDPMDPKDLAFKSSEAIRGKLVFPPPAAEVEDIKVGDSGRHVHAIVCKPVGKIGKIK
jgi:hypothetical protein